LPAYVVDLLWLVPTLPAVILMLYARVHVQRTYERFRAVPSHCKLSGSQVARLLLDSADLRHVPIEEIDGELTDYYDERHRAVRLSSHVVHEASIAALGVAAHEVGHAAQHHAAYRLLPLRVWVVPIAAYAPPLGLLLLVASLALGWEWMRWLAALLLAGAAITALTALPVESDASRRGLLLLRANGLAQPPDLEGARAILWAARLTYLALFLAAASQVVYLGLSATGVAQRHKGGSL
jgi:Zn-dependent membrane protease YugP